MTALHACCCGKGRLFDAIREGFAFVAERARHVRIRYDRIPAYADALPGYPPFNVLDAQRHFTGGEEDTAAYILTLDAVNFGSGFAPAMAEEGWEMAGG